MYIYVVRTFATTGAMLAHVGGAPVEADCVDGEAAHLEQTGASDRQLVMDLESEIELLERRLDQFR